MANSNWSYAEITSEAERQIAASLDVATRHPDSALFAASHAEGVFGLWYGLTMGWQNDGDKDRLKAMITQIRTDSMSS